MTAWRGKRRHSKLTAKWAESACSGYNRKQFDKFLAPIMPDRQLDIAYTRAVRIVFNSEEGTSASMIEHRMKRGRRPAVCGVRRPCPAAILAEYARERGADDAGTTTSLRQPAGRSAPRGCTRGTTSDISLGWLKHSTGLSLRGDAMAKQGRGMGRRPGARPGLWRLGAGWRKSPFSPTEQ